MWYPVNIVFHFLYFISYVFAVLTTRPLWVCTPLWDIISCCYLCLVLMFSFEYWGVWMEFGWNECMWWYKVGDLRLDWIWRSMFYSSLIYVGIEFDESCTAFMPSIGTRSDSVKPTGHAWFSVELCRLIWDYKLFS